MSSSACFSLFLLLSVGLICSSYSSTIIPETDMVINLPGQPKEVNFLQYAGRMVVGDGSRALFYWLVEATENPLMKPLILWLNGGPGCSSLAGGAFQEIGPFRVEEDGTTLSANPHSWNSAEDAYTFLLHWFLRFPRYKSRDFYLAGESYAGHYLPQLAQVILRMDHSFINLKGFLLGNPTIDSNNDYLGQIEYWWSLGLISESTKGMLEESCPTDSFLNPGPSCKAALKIKREEIGPIDVSNIFSNPCNDDIFMDMAQQATMFGGAAEHCFLNNTKKYLNTLDVQKAIHADHFGELYKWAACNSSVYELWADSPSSVLPIFEELIAANLRIWVFSGNSDSTVPVTSTRNSVKALNLTVLQKWYPWADDNGQVGGWAEVYEGLNFVTIRGAGHQVPMNRPEQALLMLKKFLNNEPMPSILPSDENSPSP